MLSQRQLNCFEANIRSNEPRLRNLHRHHAWRDENDRRRQKSQSNPRADRENLQQVRTCDANATRSVELWSPRSPLSAYDEVPVCLNGEVWHAYSYLQLSTHSGAIAGITAIFGLVVVVTALLLEERRDRRGVADDVSARRRACQINKCLLLMPGMIIGDVWQFLASARPAAFDYWTNLVTMRSACFTSQQSAKLIAKRLQRAYLLIDFL